MMKEEDSPYRVIVMGKTGSGKSSVLNSLSRSDHFRIGDSIMSETKDVQTFRGKFKGRLASPDIVFIDTPGFFDSSSRDNKVIAKIAMSLQKIEDGLNLVLFCFPAYEIRLDSSMQASWRFLKLVMGKAVYEHVVIVLTHGNRLASQELESAVRRMTTEFIPYLRSNLKCKVREEILVFRKGEENDGLEEVLKYITSSSKYKPKVMDDLGKFWKPEDPLGSIEYLLQNSQIFNKIQDLLLEVQAKSDDVQSQMDQIKKEMEFMTHEQNKQVKTELQEITHSVRTQFEEEKSDVSAFKEEVGQQMRIMQRQLDDRERQLELLKKSLDEMKVGGKASPQVPLTTRGKERVVWDEERSATTDREKERDKFGEKFDMEEAKLVHQHSKQEEQKHSKHTSKADMKYPQVVQYLRPQQYPTKAQCPPAAQYHSSPAHQNLPKQQAACKPPPTILKPQAPQLRAHLVPNKAPSGASKPPTDMMGMHRLAQANPQTAPTKPQPQMKQQVPSGKARPIAKHIDYSYGVTASSTPKNPYSRPGY